MKNIYLLIITAFALSISSCTIEDHGNYDYVEVPKPVLPISMMNTMFFSVKS